MCLYLPMYIYARENHQIFAASPPSLEKYSPKSFRDHKHLDRSKRNRQKRTVDFVCVCVFFFIILFDVKLYRRRWEILNLIDFLLKTSQSV